jgi:Zn-dependent M28 family amino/carboxypeptidase
MRRLIRAFREASDFPVEHLAMLPIIPGLGWSDHRSFWRHGYKAVMVTDTAFYRNPYYHTAGDTPETLDHDGLAAVTEGLFGAISRLAAVEV